MAEVKEWFVIDEVDETKFYDIPECLGTCSTYGSTLEFDTEQEASNAAMAVTSHTGKVTFVAQRVSKFSAIKHTTVEKSRCLN